VVAESESQTQSGEGQLVAGRYRLQKRLARGGAGEVFAARDESTARVVALKRMLAGAQASKAQSLSFMREYHLLAQLRHPRIIEVFDYGLDRGAPYYTMELLDGQDLSELAPTRPEEACRYLRDVASSLALLHARRMLHRDLSPRNVRLTATGQCKLIDFGTVVTFGVAPNIAGTPPFVPPEALRQSVLDPRSDLYALGALAYFLLTRKYAYPAYDFDALAQLHRQPYTRPGKLAEIPAALDELVTSLLSMDLSLRPRSAAEVIDRLSSIGALEPDRLPSVARSFIVSPTLVGRARALRPIEQLVERGLCGQGSAILIHSEPGVGRTRLLAETARFAQLRGFISIEAFARGKRATESLSAELVASLSRNAPDQAAHAWRLQADGTSISLPAPGWDAAQLPTGDARRHLQTVMLELFCKAAQLRPLLIVVDDVEDADDFTMALLASLALEARSLPLVVVATRSSRARDTAFSALASFRKAATQLELAPLDEAQTEELMKAMFGEVPHLERFSAWSFQVARGNPGLTIELAQHLLDRGAVRYLEGTWALPADTNAMPVPENLTQSLALRLDRLHPSARALAELMSVRRGALTPLLAANALQLEVNEVAAAFDELAQQGIVELAGQEYAFAQRALREGLERALSVERATELHAALAAALLSSAELTREVQLEAGWHLLHTRDELSGADLLASVGPTLLREGMNIASAIPAVEKALAAYELHGRPLAERLRLRAELVLAGYLFDYRLGTRYGEESLNLLYACSGFDQADRLRRFVWKPIAFALSATWFILRRRFIPKRDRAPHPVRVLQYIGRTVLGLMGIRATALDAAGTQALLARLYTSDNILMPAAVRLVHRAMRAFALQPCGREAELHDAVRAALRLALEGKPLLMAADEHQELVTGLLLVDGINECYRVRSQAPLRARELDQLGTHRGATGACRVRMIHYAFRGQQAAAERERRALELLGIQGGTTWQVEWFAAPVEGLVAIVMGDLLAARRALDQLDALLGHVPTLAPQRDAVRMGYHYLRGEYGRVATLAEPFLARHPPRSVIGWGPAYALIVICLAETGDRERALTLCRTALASLSKRDHEYFAMYTPLTVAHAWALALHGERERAAALLRSTAQRLAYADEHAAVAIVHNYRARLAHRCNDREALGSAMEAMRLAALAADNPALIAQAARWAHVHAALLRSSLPPPAAGSAAALAQTAVDPETAEMASSPIRAPGLELLAQTVGCRAAHQYARATGGAQHIAALSDDTPPPRLTAFVGDLLVQRTAAGVYRLELAANDNAPPPGATGERPARYDVVLLLLGSVFSAVALRDPELALPDDQLLEAVRECLTRTTRSQAAQ
jgi:hypothetical protein